MSYLCAAVWKTIMFKLLFCDEGTIVEAGAPCDAVRVVGRNSKTFYRRENKMPVTIISNSEMSKKLVGSEIKKQGASATRDSIFKPLKNFLSEQEFNVAYRELSQQAMGAAACR